MTITPDLILAPPAPPAARAIRMGYLHFSSHLTRHLLSYCHYLYTQFVVLTVHPKGMLLMEFCMLDFMPRLTAFSPVSFVLPIMHKVHCVPWQEESL